VEVLVDTSVWVDHLRFGNARLAELLEKGRVLVHSQVIGELACGNLSDRKSVLNLLRSLPSAEESTDEEVLHLLESKKLMGAGLGYTDVHLLAAALLSGAVLWTKDKPLMKAAEKLKIAWRADGL